jgi:hypothetical protein
MRRFRPLILIITVVTAAATFAAPAALADSSAVVQDCNANGHLSGHYSRGELQGALNNMGADVKEYTNCYDVIRRALLAGAAGGGGGGGSGGGGQNHGRGSSSDSPTATATGAEHSRKRTGVSTRGVYAVPDGAVPTHGANAPVSVGTADIRPGATGVNSSSGFRSLPTALIALVVLLGLAAIGASGVAIRRRVVARDGT